MSTVRFGTPLQTDPKVEESPTFLVQVEVHLDKDVKKTDTDPYIILSVASTPPATITVRPPATMDANYHVPVASSKIVQYDVAYPAGGGPDFDANLSVDLFIGGASQGPDRVSVRVHQPGPGGEKQVQTAQGKALGPLATTLGEVGILNSGLIVLSGGTRVRGEHATGVICTAYRLDNQLRMLPPGFINRAMFLPKDLFVVTMDPDAQGMYYLLHWVNDIGTILKTRNGVLA